MLLHFMFLGLWPSVWSFLKFIYLWILYFRLSFVGPCLLLSSLSLCGRHFSVLLLPVCFGSSCPMPCIYFCFPCLDNVWLDSALYLGVSHILDYLMFLFKAELWLTLCFVVSPDRVSLCFYVWTLISQNKGLTFYLQSASSHVQAFGSTF